MAPGAGLLNYGEAGKGIHSRWYPETLAKRIESIYALRKKLTFIHEDGLQNPKRFCRDAAHGGLCGSTLRCERTRRRTALISLSRCSL